MPLFSEGFLNYFTSSQFCDMTLVVRGREYNTHRIILVYNSGYFEKRLSDPKYSRKRYVRYVLNDVNDPNNLFPLVLRYVYEGRVKITDENCVPLLSLANSLEIEDLKKRIADFLSTSINRRNVLFVLQKALEFNTEDVKNKCLLVLARNFSRIASSEPEASVSPTGSSIGFSHVAGAGTGRSLRSISGIAGDRASVALAGDRLSMALAGDRSSVALSPAAQSYLAGHTIIGFNNPNNNNTSGSIIVGTPPGTSNSNANGRTHKRGGSTNSTTSPSGPSQAPAGYVPASTSPVGPSGSSPHTSSPSHGNTASAASLANAAMSTSPTGATTTWIKSTAPSNGVLQHVEQESPFKCLPVGLMLTLLSHVGLAVMNEYLVYKAVVEYIKAKGEALTVDDHNSLFEMVRYPFLNYHQLQEVIKNPQVPQHLLAEALVVRLGNFEAPSTIIPTKVSLQKRTNCGLYFEYTSDFDDRGVLHWIATQAHTNEWVNPLRYGVRVTASSIEKGTPQDALELKPTECWTKDVPSSWFSFDLGKHRQLVLTYYTLRHGSNSRQDCLRNWVLQCSDDGIEWETIKRHNNECAMNQGFATASWPVMCINPHRFFRILQTGHNSTNKNFFSLSGVEFYGDFYQTS